MESPLGFVLPRGGGELRSLWRQSLEMAYQRRTVFRCKRNKGIYYWKFRCNQEGGGRNGNNTRVASTVRCNWGEWVIELALMTFL